MSAETELELQRAVGRIEGLLESLTTEVRTANRNHISVSAALSKRLYRVEKWQTRVVGWSAGIAFAISLGFKLLFSRNR